MGDEHHLASRGHELSNRLRKLVQHSQLLKEQSADLCEQARAMRHDGVTHRDAPEPARGLPFRRAD